MNRASISRKLPRRMYFKHGRYYYVSQNKWTPLARDYADSLIAYANLIRAPEANEKLPAVIDRYLAEVRARLSVNTLSSYETAARKLKTVFVEFTPSQIKPVHVAQMLDHYRDTPGAANIMRNVLKQVCAKAVLWGLSETNPVQFVAPHRLSARDRYLTDAEFTAIRSAASPTLLAVMDICYLTGQRIGDVLGIRYADISPDGILFQQRKTGNRLKVLMSDDLRAAIETARRLHRSVKGLTLFHARDGRPIHYETVRVLWERACCAAGIENAHIHDIRAKAATDAKAQGLDSKKLLGHASESSHLRYLRSREIPFAEPVRLKKS